MAKQNCGNLDFIFKRDQLRLGVNFEKTNLSDRIQEKYSCRVAKFELKVGSRRTTKI